MPRPYIPPDQLALCLEAAQSVYSSALFHIAKAAMGQERAEEMSLCSAWLDLQLFEAGCPARLAEAISYKYGSQCATGLDPWDIAQDLLRRWKMGLPLTSRIEAN